MSDIDRIRILNERLRQIEERRVPNWQRPIVEVARDAILQEIASVGQRIERWRR